MQTQTWLLPDASRQTYKHFVDALKTIARTEGVRGLYRGFGLTGALRFLFLFLFVFVFIFVVLVFAFALSSCLSLSLSLSLFLSLPLSLSLSLWFSLQGSIEVWRLLLFF